MKVITIKEPFATLIKEGLKEYEFRTWKTNYRGEILIHAGKGIDKKAMKKYEHLNLKYQSGCIIAKAKITDCVFIDDDMRKKLKQKNPLVYSSIIKHKEWVGYGFKLEDVESIDPIKINGRLSLWDYDYENEIKQEKV
ncbi:MAG: ASCH domain-containing protein [Bacilli bacterium]|nr:ASCH domain-containing protein [Bacilli bacterium]